MLDCGYPAFVSAGEFVRATSRIGRRGWQASLGRLRWRLSAPHRQEDREAPRRAAPARIARAAFLTRPSLLGRSRCARGGPRRRDVRGPLPALAPWRRARATILQFADGLSAVRAADAVRSRLDWKYVPHTSSAVGRHRSILKVAGLASTGAGKLAAVLVIARVCSPTFGQPRDPYGSRRRGRGVRPTCAKRSCCPLGGSGMTKLHAGRADTCQTGLTPAVQAASESNGDGDITSP